MPSIFVWKANTPNLSTTHIQYFVGPDWYVEEHPSGSKNISYCNQYYIDHDVIAWNIRIMPESWFGSQLLSILSVPYQLIKKDEYGTLEHLGKWMRCTLTVDMEANQIMETYQTIKTWIASSIIPPAESCPIPFSKHRPLSHTATPFRPSHMMKKEEYDFHETKKRL